MKQKRYIYIRYYNSKLLFFILNNLNLNSLYHSFRNFETIVLYKYYLFCENSTIKNGLNVFLSNVSHCDGSRHGDAMFDSAKD